MAWMCDKEIKRELPKEWNDIVPTDVFIQESERLVEKAKGKGITLRVVGGLGIAIKCRNFRDFAVKLGRVGTGVTQQEYSDIDLVSYRKHRDQVKSFLNEMEYGKRRATLSSAASERQIYYHPKGWFCVDVFFDRLMVANHPIDFGGRLDLDYPTITATDALLEKIQMWEAFSAKDLKDCLLLLKSCAIKEENGIDANHVAQLLSSDWGFWYTATSNLKKIQRFVSDLERFGVDAGIDPGKISSNDRNEIIRKVEALLKAIEEEPKSFAWKMRAKVGTNRRWYNPVERPDTVGGFGIWEAIK
jgi:hypothetical protein